MKIKRKYRLPSACLLTLLLGISLVSIAAAIDFPAIPNYFSGSIQINGVDAPAGTEIRAYIGSNYAGSCTIQKAGWYELPVRGTDNDNEKSIIFRILNLEADQTILFNSKNNTPQTLDLNFSGEYDAEKPVLSSPAAFPRSILNDGVDSSAVTVKATDRGLENGSETLESVTIDLSQIGGVPKLMTSSGEDTYTYLINSTKAGNFIFPITAADYAKNTNSTSVSLNVLTTEQAVSQYKAETLVEVEDALNKYRSREFSKAIMYLVLRDYFRGWEDLL